MKGPARNGVIIYSNDLNKLANFYQQLFGMRLLRETNEFKSLGQDGLNLIIHQPPFEMPESSQSAVKLFVSVDDINAARVKTLELGGQVFDGEWSNPLFKVANIADCDGNHVQLREFLEA